MDHSCRRAALPFGLHAVRRSLGKRACEESVPARAVHRRRRAVEGWRGDGGVFESRGEWGYLKQIPTAYTQRRGAEGAEPAEKARIAVADDLKLEVSDLRLETPIRAHSRSGFLCGPLRLCVGFDF